MEYERYRKKWKEWNNNPKKNKKPKLNKAVSRKYWKLVKKYTDKYMKSDSNTKNNSLIMFQAAMSRVFLGEKNKSKIFFNKIIKQFPNSILASESNFVSAESLYESRKYREAIRYYLLATKKKEYKKIGWAYYKIAWSYYELKKKYKKAINFWKKSIDHTNLVSDFRLRDEALISIIEAYVSNRKIKISY